MDVGNGALLRPVITGADQILNLPAGTLISGASNFVAGESGSSTHVGGGAGQWQLNTPGYMGATFRSAPAGPDYYGWVQMEMSNSGAGKIISWAYENINGNSILAGQTPPSVPEAGTVALGLAVILTGLNRRARSLR